MKGKEGKWPKQLLSQLTARETVYRAPNCHPRNHLHFKDEAISLSLSLFLSLRGISPTEAPLQFRKPNPNFIFRNACCSAPRISSFSPFYIEYWLSCFLTLLCQGFVQLRAMEESRLVERDFTSTISKESPRSRRSLSLSFSPLMIIDGIFSRKSLSYNKLPSEPLRLSVLKLDGSCFDIVITKTATIAELRQAVEEVFSHMPQKGPGKISWPHVWGQFCLCYDGQKLVTEKDYLRNYGIKDGDQLCFVRHVSNNSSLRRRRYKKRIVCSKRSSSKVDSYHQKDHGDGSDDEIGLDDIVIDKGDIQHYNNGDGLVKNHENRLTVFLGGLFSCTRLAVMRKTRTQGRICPIRIARGFLGSFRKIGRVVNFCRKRQYYRKHALVGC